MERQGTKLTLWVSKMSSEAVNGAFSIPVAIATGWGIVAESARRISCRPGLCRHPTLGYQQN